MENAISNILDKILNVKILLTETQQLLLLKSILKYMEHGRKEGIIAGRTIDTFEYNLTEITDVLTALGLSQKEIADILIKNPTILNDINFLYRKLILLGAIENEKNSVRKESIIKKSQDLRVSLALIYARFAYLKVVNYPSINWTILLHHSEAEFASVFVKGRYFKAYQTLKNEMELTSEILINTFPIEYNVIEEMKELPVNTEFVSNYIGKTKNI